MKTDWLKLAENNDFDVPEAEDVFIEEALQEALKDMIEPWLEANAILYFVARKASSAYLGENMSYAQKRDFARVTNIKPRVVFTETLTTSALWYKDRSLGRFKKQDYFRLNRENAVFRNIFASESVPLWAKVRGPETEAVFRAVRNITEKLSRIRRNLYDASALIMRLYEGSRPGARHPKPLRAADFKNTATASGLLDDNR